MTDGGQQAGQREHDQSVFEEVYAQLRALAGAHFRAQPASHTLQPTALVHEAYMKVSGSSSESVRDREHLLALASRAMRQVLVDHARKKKALKRDHGHRLIVTLSGVGSNEGEWDVLELHEAIERLERLDPRQAQIVELRFFGGLTVAQSADMLGVSERTVHLDWHMARAWLLSELRGEGA